MDDLRGLMSSAEECHQRFTKASDKVRSGDLEDFLAGITLSDFPNGKTGNRKIPLQGFWLM